MAKKPRKKEEDIDSYRHEAETRKNAVSVVDDMTKGSQKDREAN